jgi:hypothetical protein
VTLISCRINSSSNELESELWVPAADCNQLGTFCVDAEDFDSVVEEYFKCDIETIASWLRQRQQDRTEQQLSCNNVTRPWFKSIVDLSKKNMRDMGFLVDKNDLVGIFSCKLITI